MKVHNYEQATIQTDKLLKYLLNFAHPKGGAKAKFFAKHGYKIDNFAEFEAELRRILEDNEVLEEEALEFGVHYVVIGVLNSKTTHNLLLKTVWCILYENESAAFSHCLSFLKMRKIEEFEVIVLTEDLPKHNLQAGDVGTVVDIHRNGEGYTVEFTTLDGETVAVVMLFANQVRTIGRGEMSHSRALAA